MKSNRSRRPSRLVHVVGVAGVAAIVFGSAVILATESEKPTARQGAYAKWQNGPRADADFFPIAVWLQDPRNAPRYQAIGVNLCIGLWKGPTEQQIAELARHKMPVICEQNEYALKHLDEKTIVGWMHGDEPDNAQSRGQGKGYGPPIPPATIIDEYRRIRAGDSTRPVVLNLGQGVAWDGWHGRGVRTNHPEDYLEYVQGGDIVSFDIYPAVHDRPAVAGKLWYVARGVRRLREWAGGQRIVWNCIECTRISNVKTKPTPQQVKAEVWMSIIHGSRGIIYFCHQFQPRFIEAGLLEDKEMAQAVAAINREVHALAAVINSHDIPEAASVAVHPAEVAEDMARLLGPENSPRPPAGEGLGVRAPGASSPRPPAGEGLGVRAPGPCGIAVSVKRHRGRTYLFAVRMEASPAKGRFEVKGLAGRTAVGVLGENRVLRATDGRFKDDFGPHGVHLYEIDAGS